MIYPDVSIEEWRRRYPILAEEIDREPLECECGKYGEIQPFASKRMVGFVLTCRCRSSVSIPRTKESLQEWQGIFQSIFNGRRP